MARRILDTAFWDDTDVAKLDYPERLLLICMITDESLSNDYGWLPAHPALLKKHAFGYDSCSVAEVETWRDTILETCKNVKLYSMNGQEYIDLVKFPEWQKLRYQRKTHLPPPPWYGEEALAASEAEREEHLKADRASGLIYREAHKEEIHIRQRAYRQTPKGKELERRQNHRRLAREAGVPATLTQTEWQASLDFFGNCCAYCGDSDVSLSQEHIVPLSAGGGYVAENVVPACSRCNESKHKKPLEDWLVEPASTFVLKNAGERIKEYLLVVAETSRNSAETSRLTVTIAPSGLSRDGLSSEGKDTASAPRPRASSGKNAIRKALEEHFVRTTKLPRPPMATASQKRAAGRRWWAPLTRMAELTDWNLTQGIRLIDEARKRLEGLTVSAPESLLKTAEGIIGDWARGKSHGRDSPQLSATELAAMQEEYTHD